MLLKIILVGALLIGVMAAIKDGRVLKDAGLLEQLQRGRRQRQIRADGHGLLEGPNRRLAGSDEQVVHADLDAPHSRVLALPGTGRLLADADWVTGVERLG